MTPKFDIGQAIGFGWTKTKEHFLKFSGICLIYIFLQTMTKAGGFTKAPLIQLCLSFVAVVAVYFTFVAHVGIIRISLAVVDGKSFKISDICEQNQQHLLRYVLAGIVRLLIILVGFLLLIIPGFILLYKYICSRHILS
jgi:ABC-type xylose transport system permease subunit